ncbi:MAG TPA: HEAT repeat domain-containing protein, partial [Planctomycetota bacterium]|nr:HEAT repeat domain-containing protein [Planctomycetota bacterium]
APVFLPVGDLMSGSGLGPPCPILLTLNALRAPETWSRFRKTSVPEGLQGTVLPDAAILARHLGLKMEFSPEVSQWKGLSERRYYSETVPTGMALRELMSSSWETGLQFLFDGPTLRVLTQAEALTEWKRWYVAREPADDEERTEVAEFRRELARAALPAEERAALEAREREEAKSRHRKERAKFLEGVLTPGLQTFETRLLDGDEGTWSQIALELVAKPGQKTSLSAADLDVLVYRAVAATTKPEDRAKILALAKVVQSNEIPEWVRSLLQDPDGSIRAGAVRLLDPKKHLNEIRPLAGDPSAYVRSFVADALWERYPQESIQILKALSLEADWQVCDRATMNLSYRAGPDLIPHMIGQLKRSTSNFNAAHSALSYLGRQGAREAIPAILPLLEQERPTSVGPALQALLELGARESMPRILNAVRKNPLSGLRTVDLIEAFQVQEVLPDLYAVLESENDYSKNRVLLALARMGKLDVIPSIRKLLHHEFVEVRASACEALALLQGRDAQPAILEAFRDPDFMPLDALVRVNATEAVPELSKRLREYHPALIQALVDLDGREALPRMFAILDKPTPTAQFSEGLKAVARAYPKESIPTLRIHLTSDNSFDRTSAAAMLCETGSGEGVPILIENNVPAFSLNAIRRPEAWRALHHLRIDETLFGTGAELLERIALKAGLKVEQLPADAVDIKAWTGHYYFLPKGARPLRAIEVIDRLEDPRWAFILEKDTLRLVPRDTALKFWKEWSGGAPKK